MRPRYLIALAASLSILAAGCAGEPAKAAAPKAQEPGPAAQPSQQSGGRVTKRYPAAPAMSIDANKQYAATLHTSEGDIQIDLLVQDAPVTVNNFVFLARDSFYDGVRFHRIIKGFMVQTGDPQGNGTGGPGYRFQDEPVKRDYKPGTVAMANAGPNTNGSQFFIVHGDYSGRLPKNYTIFGQVTGGMEVLEKIASTPVSSGPSGELSSPSKEVTITSVEIAER